MSRQRVDSLATSLRSAVCRSSISERPSTALNRAMGTSLEAMRRRPVARPAAASVNSPLVRVRSDSLPLSARPRPPVKGLARTSQMSEKQCVEFSFEQGIIGSVDGHEGPTTNDKDGQTTNTAQHGQSPGRPGQPSHPSYQYTDVDKNHTTKEENSKKSA